ncbi:MAG: hypothetical protein N2376_13250 [Clostridia bacterium]|nr:hypothetical protein [Clostridia bacterium]
MFDLKFYIVGGFIKIKKNAFMKEMLGKDSTLRTLLDWRSTDDFEKDHPQVTEPDDEGNVTIRFNSRCRVYIGEEYENFLVYLKEKYKENVKGCVSCQGTYGLLYTFDIDLNSDGLKIIHN